MKKMTKADRLQIIQQIASLKELPPDLMDQLADQASVFDFLDGQTVFKRGDFGDSLWYVVEGQVRILLGDRPKEPVSYLQPGDFFGEIGLLTHSQRTADVVAVGHTVLFEFKKNLLLQIMQQHPALKRQLGKIGAKRSQESMERLEGD